MAQFKGGIDKKGIQKLNTSSLPDIVFMLLFFFMISTSFRQTEKMVMVKVPEASEVVKLERKDLANYIYVGTPMQQYRTQYGTDSRIQLNDQFSNIEDIRDFIASARESMSEADRGLMQTVLKIDASTRMGIVTDIKQELRRCGALKTMYNCLRSGAVKNN